MAQVVDQSFIDSDPQIQAILRSHPNASGAGIHGHMFAADDAIKQNLAQRGLAIADDYYVGPTGKILQNEGLAKGLVHYGKYGLMAATGVGAIGALAGAGGAAGAGAIADPGIGAAGVPNSLAAGAGGASAAGTVAGAVGGGTSLWKTLAAPVIGAGAGVAGSLIQANQNDKATQAELQKAKEAQAFLEKKYEQTQNQVAPYVTMGQGALAALGNGLGVTPANPAVLQPGQSRPIGQTTSSFLAPNDFSSFKQQVQAQNPTAQIPNMPAQQNQAASAQNLSQSSVRLQAPTGEVQNVPADHAQYYISQGAKVVA
jgi:hypothetical protein